MDFSELFPTTDEVLKGFVLHKSDVKVFDFSSASPMMFSMSTLIHEEVMKSPFYGILNAMISPIFLLSMKYSDDVRIGMGWIFEKQGPLLGYSSEGGTVHAGNEAVTYERICMLKHDGKRHYIATLSGGDETGLPFTHVVEVNARSNSCEFGMLDRETGVKLFGIKQLSTRPCVICYARGEACVCTQEMVSRGFEPLPLTIQSGDGLRSFDFNDDVFQRSFRQWMGGRWDFHVNRLPAFSVQSDLLSSGEAFERAKTYLVEQEIQQSIRFRPPVQRSSMERALASIVSWNERKESRQAIEESSNTGDATDPSIATDPEASTDQDVSTEPKASRNSNVQTTLEAATELSAELVDSPRIGCKKCRASFTSAWGLRRHDAGVHQNTRSFPCEFCSRTFKQSGHLNEHLRAYHSKGGGYECEECGKRFGVKSKLDRHIIGKHTDIRLFACKMCHMKYKEKHQLAVHTRRKHSSTESDKMRVEECEPEITYSQTAR
ncbi:hypothetical protein NDN08_007246 [Rhodosorus marinus]|uniref:C2H2-type domain-containing protein n=1 Tax=Rhodosorus marinus TaxID=101924 RepID=A0AAV8UFY0_9RHOD|nr:hypothetical protein NDN08_007246 [Rhodosorus marinus]